MMKFTKVILSGFMTCMLAFGQAAMAQEITQTADLNVNGVTVTETTSTTVTLAWDAIPDAGSYTVEYGTEPVVEQGDTYNQPPEETDTNQITIEDLLPSTTYYFSVVAFSTDGSTASQEYSEEVSATTLADEETGFNIVDVETIDAGTVEIEFNEAVLLPENPREEITIQLLDTPSESLNVLEVMIKENENNIVVVNTEAQSPDTNYVLELSGAFENAAAQTIPEVSRTQGFTGYNAANSEGTIGAMTGLRLENIQALRINDLNVVEIDFNADIALDASDVSAFTIVKTNDPNQFLNVNEIRPNNQDPSKYLLVTDEQENTSYSLIMTALQSDDGQTMSEDNAIVEFQGVVEGEETTDEPTDIDEVTLANLRVTTNEESVTLLWDAPSAEDNISEVRVALSTDNGNTFEEVKTGIDPMSGNTSIENLQVGTNNQLRITLVVDGEETEGQIIDFEIAETGPATSLALVLGFAGLTSYAMRRKNQFAHSDHF